MRVADLSTPALVVDRTAFEANVALMADARPGPALRPHVKAFKSTELARRLVDAGHRGFCCATSAEVLGMAGACLGDDLLLANETVDGARLRAMARADARVTVAVDSADTVDAAAAAGMEVRGVMGYEGRVTIIEDRDERRSAVERAMERLLHAHERTGGEIVSGGATMSTT